MQQEENNRLAPLIKNVRGPDKRKRNVNVESILGYVYKPRLQLSPKTMKRRKKYNEAKQLKRMKFILSDLGTHHNEENKKRVAEDRSSTIDALNKTLIDNKAPELASKYNY